MYAGVISITEAFYSLVRPRAKVLAREHRRLRAELVRVRQENGLTQADIAELLQITPQAVSKLERYDADPKLSTLARYANAVGALIEHRVTVDRGRSVVLAASNGWGEGRTTTTIAPIATGAAPSPRPSASIAWAADSRRTDFALAG